MIGIKTGITRHPRPANPPGRIFHVPFAGTVTDMVTGHPFDTTLPAEYGKTVDDIFGKVRHYGANQARHTGAGSLLEGESKRENLCAIDFSQWIHTSSGLGSDPVIVSTTELAPDGTYTATRIRFNLNGGTLSTDQSKIFISATGLANPHDSSYGVWVKNGAESGQTFWMRDFVSGTNGGVFTTTDSWRRAKVEGETATATNVTFTIGLRGGELCDDYVDIIIWGAQIELKPRLSSLIPGDGEAKTRATDAASAGPDGNGYKFLLANNQRLAAALASKGAFHSLFQPRFAFTDGLTDLGLWTVNDTVEGPLYIGPDSKLTMSDGTNVISLDYAYSFEEQLDVRPWWDGNSMGLKLYDAMGNLLDENGGSFVGAWPNVGYLKAHYANEAACIQRVLSGYDNAEAA